MLDEGTDAGAVSAEHARELGVDPGHVYSSALDGYAARMPSTVADKLADDPRVGYVQADRAVSTFAQTTPSGINRANADASPTAEINGVDERVNVDVAVIDTGVDLDHPDLNVNRTKAKNCAVALSADDDHGHGTHVAGTIGAIDNGTGVVGMAPGARIWQVKVLNAAGVGFTSDIVCGIDYVTANAASIEVANMSLGGGGEDDGNCGQTIGDAEHEAICASVAAGVTHVVAAGNDSEDAANSTPAAYDEVVTVSALADFNGLPGGYNTISGTSMASPHVAGGAALYAANNPSATPAQVKSALQSSGSLDWNDVDDPDPTKERLLDATTL